MNLENYNKPTAITKAEAISLLRPGQAVYAVCNNVFLNRNQSFFTTAVAGLSLVQPSTDFEKGKGVWFEIISIKEQNQFLYVKPAKKSKFIIDSGTLCLGVVSEKTDNTITVRIAPELTVSLSKKEVGNDWDTIQEETLCAVEYLTQRFSRYVTYQPAPGALDLPPTIRNNFTCPTDRLDAIAEKGGHVPITDGIRGWIKHEIANSYEIAFNEDAIIKKGNGFDFEFKAFRAKTFNGAPIFIGMKKNTFEYGPDQEAIPWHVEFGGVSSHAINRVLERDAYVQDLPKQIARLAQIALPESWTYGPLKNSPYYILNSYINLMYYNAWFRDLLYTTDDGKLMVFNTSLVGYGYKPIYGVLERTTNKKKKWQLCGFCIPGSGELGQRLKDAVLDDKLPPRVEFIQRMDDLFMDTSKKVHPNTEHILLDNLERLPKTMLLKAAGEYYSTISDLVRKCNSNVWKEREDAIVEIKRFISTHREDYFARLCEILDKAIYNAVQRAKWNYKTAVPVYFAVGNCVDLLLPLCLSNVDDVTIQKPDVALVISKDKETGDYNAETIFTLDMAYLDSRMICRPESSWLTPDATE